ncbi:MAG: type II toxin-antitoxin system VapC family toxin [Solirubrobacterales bacterium]|nr:type II toxin-antitoxin system VapC family toxin [Solirubrobacterales bacterium]MCB8915727.1 type II toxin-antitoxin system VapC family toxin [Thermoleophilales bacterium]
MLDSSALLAYLQLEPGEDAIRAALAGGSIISSVNLSEVLEVLSRANAKPDELAREMDESGVLFSALLVEEFTHDDSIEAARLRPLTRHLGLSLADRACLALASRMEFPVLTADQAWAELDLGLDIRVIR